MSPLDPQTPEVSEEIHLPGPSAQPLLITIGITATLIGVTFHIAVLVFGIVLTLWQAVAWIRETRDDIQALPQDH